MAASKTTQYDFINTENLPRRDFKPLQPGVAYLYPLKTSEYLQVFRGYRQATPSCNGLSKLFEKVIIEAFQEDRKCAEE